MPIDRAIVEHVSNLAYVGLTADEVNEMTQQLASVLEYVSMLQAVDTEGIEPTGHALPLADVMRDDEVAPSRSPAAVLANAPVREDGFFEVQAVLD
jgi:aspartyl-tRNA(Asn)/glutamyl-tRNA(Gln) amidotransferase subunit C